jgi:hypothetical protein
VAAIFATRASLVGPRTPRAGALTVDRALEDEDPFDATPGRDEDFLVGIVLLETVTVEEGRMWGAFTPS